MASARDVLEDGFRVGDAFGQHRITDTLDIAHDNGRRLPIAVAMRQDLKPPRLSERETPVGLTFSSIKRIVRFVSHAVQRVVYSFLLAGHYPLLLSVILLSAGALSYSGIVPTAVQWLFSVDWGINYLGLALTASLNCLQLNDAVSTFYVGGSSL